MQSFFGIEASRPVQIAAAIAIFLVLLLLFFLVARKLTGALRLVIKDEQQELLPLRRWADDRLKRSSDNGSAEVHLDFAALERMAELCGIPTVDLIGRLRRLNPS